MTATAGNINRRTRWREELVTEVIEIPIWDEETKETLFYNKMDYHEFQEAEQRRYDRMMSKHIQRLVYEKMAPEIQAATDRGATPEEIEAMMPQTTEAIFDLIGGIPEMPAQLKAKNTETIHRKSDVRDSTTENSASLVTKSESLGARASSEGEGAVESPQQPTEAAQHHIQSDDKDGHLPDSSDEDIYLLFGVDATSSSNSVPKQEEETKAKDSASKSPILQPADETTDDDIYALFGVDDSSAGVGPGTADVNATCQDSIRQASDSSLNISHDDLQAQNSFSKSIDDSIASLHEIQDEINEVLGTSMSKETHLEDLIPNQLQEMDGNNDDEKSEDNNENFAACDNERPEDVEDLDEMSLQEKFESMLPDGLLSGPRYTRDSILLSKVKHSDEQ